MKQPDTSEKLSCLKRAQPSFRPLWRRIIANALTLLAAILAPRPAHASLFEGEQLDRVANIMSWVVLVIVPIIVLVIFWIIHILPEKIAEKRHHPQAKAIQCLCIMSLVFGGLLWPLAWLWAYSRPVFHKMAYGTDIDESHGHSESGPDTHPSSDTDTHSGPNIDTHPFTDRDKDLEALSDEAALLRARIAQLESQLNHRGADV